MSPFDLENSTVLIPRQGKRHEPFSTLNSQATLDRHINLTGPFTCSLTDIFHHQCSLTTCHFKFVLHATHMSRDDIFFKNLPPLQKSSIRATIFLRHISHPRYPHQLIPFSNQRGHHLFLETSVVYYCSAPSHSIAVYRHSCPHSRPRRPQHQRIHIRADGC